MRLVEFPDARRQQLLGDRHCWLEQRPWACKVALG